MGLKNVFLSGSFHVVGAENIAADHDTYEREIYRHKEAHGVVKLDHGLLSGRLVAPQRQAPELQEGVHHVPPGQYLVPIGTYATGGEDTIVQQFVQVVRVEGCFSDLVEGHFSGLVEVRVTRG